MQFVLSLVGSDFGTAGSHLRARCPTGESREDFFEAQQQPATPHGTRQIHGFNPFLFLIRILLTTAR